MNYFFTFFLQALLPFSLLLGVYHSKQSAVSAKKIIWLSLFGFTAGIVLRLSLPTGQTDQFSAQWRNIGTIVYLYLMFNFRQRSLTGLLANGINAYRGQLLGKRS